MNIEVKEASIDGLIYDIITITIDNPCWVESAKIVALLVIHTIFMTLKTYEPLKQYDPLSLRKLTGEGQLFQTQDLSGMGHKTPLSTGITTDRKNTSRVREIRESLALTKISTENMEYLIGKPNHASHIITLDR